ncbi:MAG: ferrous iron transport protein A [Pontiellaceae bacterium]|jgi:Fe2+ transport system protein FeoA|nr:ferrous iron transport protein A [Pontiellaceae bacterium]
MFRNLFRQRHCHRQRCGHSPENGICCAHPLSDFAEDAEVVVVCNGDRKTLEMGLFSGARVHVIKNRPDDANMVVAAGEGRYIISKKTARKIQVR